MRLRPTHRVILWCVAAVSLPVAVGSLLGGLLALLVLKQSQPVADKSVAALSESYNAAGQDLLAQLAGTGGNRAQSGRHCTADHMRHPANAAPRQRTISRACRPVGSRSGS